MRDKREGKEWTGKEREGDISSRNEKEEKRKDT